MKFTFQPESRPLDGYTLKRGIARGGFGEVYYALSDAGKEVAVKLLQHNLDIELRGVQQCLNLRHPNLVSIYDVKTDADNDHWVVMEYIAGQTLEQFLQSRPGPLPIDQIERWLSGLAAGLGYLHDRGIVHRDVKPGNVFWDQGAVKLGDIGLSKFMTPSRRSAHTESVGTVYYMAPEVSYGNYGYEVDIYSVGVMLYEMLTGQLPFDGQSTGEILMKHLSEPPDLNLVPAQYRYVVASALEKDPKKRTGSMSKLIDEFHAAQRGVPVAAQTGFATPFPAVPPPIPKPGDYVANPWIEPPPKPIGVAAGVAGRTTPAVATAAASLLPNNPWNTRAGVLLASVAVFLTFMSVGIGFVSFPIAALTFMGLLILVRVISPNVISPQWQAWLRTEFFPTPKPATVYRPPVMSPVVVQPVSGERPAKPRATVGVNQRRLPLPPKGIHQRLAELSTSLSWATVLTLIFGAGTGFLSPLFGNVGSVHPDFGKLGLFTLTTLLGAWSVLIVSKIQEGRQISTGHRRVTGLVAGAAVGSAAWWLSQTLLVDLPVGASNDAMVQVLGRQPLVLGGEPTWLGYSVFFGLLFGLRRWWWHADANRPALFRVSSVVLTVALAGILPKFFLFPWDWAVTWAAVTSCVVQLSAVWVPDELRPSA